MPDLSDVGPPATGPGLPQRVAEAPPPTVRIFIEHPYNHLIKKRNICNISLSESEEYDI